MTAQVIFESLGTTGSLLVCASAIPQILKTYRTKSAGDLSIVYLGILMFGMALLQVYSIYVNDFVFIFGNTLSVLTTGVLIAFWFKYKMQKKKRARTTITIPIDPKGREEAFKKIKGGWGSNLHI